MHLPEPLPEISERKIDSIRIVMTAYRFTM